MNPLIDTSCPKSTAQNVSEAFAAVIELIALKDSNLCKLLLPIQGAIDHLAGDE